MIKRLLGKMLGRKKAPDAAPSKKGGAKKPPGAAGAAKKSAKKPTAAEKTPRRGTGKKPAAAAGAPKKKAGKPAAAGGAPKKGAKKPSAAGGAPGKKRTTKPAPAEGASKGARGRSSTAKKGVPEGKRGSTGAGRPRREGRKGRDQAGQGRDRSRSRSTVSSRPSRFVKLPEMPHWSPPEDPTRFENYDLPAQVREGIAKAGFENCTEVQSKVLPLALGGKDVAAQSQTGTGKTAAFLITIFSRLLRRGPVDHPGPRALVLAPTRELTVQIENDAHLLGGTTGLKVGVAFGGVDYEKQRRILEEGVDLLIGTPGRMIDYLKQGVWKPEGIEVLVIDEADRMLDMGFIRDLRFILRRLPSYEDRLSMLFSATLSYRAMELTYEYMDLPEQISASPEKVTAERAEELLYHVERREKAALLLGLMKKQSWDRTIIFANMKIEAEKVGRLLALHGYKAEAITGNLEQKRRLRLMEEFKSGELPILVATDVASRGLHVEAVSHVVNWDLPQDPEDYVHRIGRTARAGEAGNAVSFADEQCVYNLEGIEKLIGYKIPVHWHTSDDLAEVKRGWVRDPNPRKAPPGKRGGGSRQGRSGGDRGRSSSRRPPRRS